MKFDVNANFNKAFDNDFFKKGIANDINSLTKDEDNNGIPDFADEIIKDSKVKKTSNSSSNVQININGKTFDNMADASKYVAENVPALKFVNNIFGSGISNKTNDTNVIDGEVLDEQPINKTLNNSQVSTNNSINTVKSASKVDLMLGLIILSLVIAVVLYFLFF